MGDTRIEESGENWRMRPEDHRPTVQVVTTVRSVERTETVKGKGKRKGKKREKRQPFGFGRGAA